MLNLNFGVIDVPYDNGGVSPPRVKRAKKPRKGKAQRKGKNAPAAPPREPAAPTTTVQVATILEDKYGVVQTFYEANQDNILGAIVHSLEVSLEGLFMGAPVANPFAEADDEIGAAFRVWLQQGDIEQLGLPGVPTQAAIDRRSLRFKSKKGPAQRPSFVDTGLFELSMRAWIE